MKIYEVKKKGVNLDKNKQSPGQSLLQHIPAKENIGGKMKGRSE